MKSTENCGHKLVLKVGSYTEILYCKRPCYSMEDTLPAHYTGPHHLLISLTQAHDILASVFTGPLESVLQEVV